MLVHLLLTEEQRTSIPEEIRQVQDFGEVTIVTNPEDNQWAKKYFRGQHILLEGEANNFQEWLFKYNSICVGVGQPMEQRFKFMEKE